MTASSDPHLITDEAQLRAIIGAPTEIVRSKIADRLNPVTAALIQASPFALIATGDPQGGMDISPRGDPAGFVRILDERTLLMPERPGNRLADSLVNVLRDDRIAVLFMIPGANSIFRVNGRARITDDEALLAPSTEDGKAPRLGFLITVEEAFSQCHKALLRSDLWNPDQFRRDTELPTMGQIFASLHADFDAEAYDAERAGRYARREGFY